MGYLYLAIGGAAMITPLPKLKMNRTALENVHDSLAILILIFSVAYTAARWSSLPQTIAIHFNAGGEPDNWGSKAFLLIGPAISLLFYIGLSLLRKTPHQFNYMTTITEQNAAHHYQISLAMLSWIKFELVVLFGYMQWSIIQNAEGKSAGLGLWLLPAVLVILFGTIVIYTMKSKKIQP